MNSHTFTEYNNQGCIDLKNHHYDLAIENLNNAIELD